MMDTDEARRLLGLSEGPLETEAVRRAYLSALDAERDPDEVARLTSAFERLLAAGGSQDATGGGVVARAELSRVGTLPAAARAPALVALVEEHPRFGPGWSALAHDHLERGAISEALGAAREATSLGDLGGLLAVATVAPSVLSADDRERIASGADTLTAAKLLASVDPPLACDLALRGVGAGGMTAPETILTIAGAIAIEGRGDLAEQVLSAFRAHADRTVAATGRVARALHLLTLALYVPEPFPPDARRALLRGVLELAHGDVPRAIDEYTRANHLDALKARETLRKHAKELNTAVGAHFVRGATAPRSKVPEWILLLLVGACVVRGGVRMADGFASKVSDALAGWEDHAGGWEEDDVPRIGEAPRWMPDDAPMPEDRRDFEDWATRPTGWSTDARTRLVERGCPGARTETRCERAMLFADVLEAGDCRAQRNERDRFLADYPTLLGPTLLTDLDAEISACDAAPARE